MNKQMEQKPWTLKRIASICGAGIVLVFIIGLLFFGDKSSKLNVEKERLTLSDYLIISK